MSAKENIHPPKRLQYKRGDLIMKEGDYGISIYKVISGKILISREYHGREVGLATLGAGEILGETAFLNRAHQVRSASARAAEDTVLEVYHSGRLVKEYEEMPPVLKQMTNQVLRRLANTDDFLLKLKQRRHEEKDRQLRGVSEKSRRRYYRKDVSVESIYMPVESHEDVRLKGVIRDLSLTGTALEVKEKNVRITDHNPGRRFRIRTVLPNGKHVSFLARVMSTRKTETPGSVLVGMAFEDMPDETKKSLGFFMMPG